MSEGGERDRMVKCLFSSVSADGVFFCCGACSREIQFQHGLLHDDDGSGGRWWCAQPQLHSISVNASLAMVCVLYVLLICGKHFPNPGRVGWNLE